MLTLCLLKATWSVAQYLCSPPWHQVSLCVSLRAGQEEAQGLGVLDGDGAHPTAGFGLVSPILFHWPPESPSRLVLALGATSGWISLMAPWDGTPPLPFPPQPQEPYSVFPAVSLVTRVTEHMEEGNVEV